MQKTGSLIVLVAALVAFPAFADETRAVAEIYACDFVEGKGWSDLEEAAEFYNAQLKKLGSGLEEIGSFAWEPYRGDVPFDFLWSTNSPNLNEMGRMSLIYDASKEGQAADAKFATVATCRSGVMFQEQIFEADPPDLTNGYLIESYVCTINPGKDMADVREAIKGWHAYVTKTGLDNPVWMRTPLIGSVPWDMSYFVVHKDIADFASGTTDYLTSEGAEANQAALDAVQTCNSALWRGQRMTP